MENGLFAKPEKCEFHKASVSFLGYIIRQGHLAANPAKVRAVAEWPVHGSRKELQRFLGFANFYRRFIWDYSRIVEPLTRLTSTQRVFQWTEKAQEAFERLKRLFTTAPVLAHPDPARQFMVEVDASESQSAILSQRTSTDDKVHPCAFL